MLKNLVVTLDLCIIQERQIADKKLPGNPGFQKNLTLGKEFKK